jgi:hypothetical protein
VKKSFSNVSLGTGKIKTTSLPNHNTIVNVPIYDDSGHQSGVIETIMRFEDRGQHMGHSNAPARAMPVSAVPIPATCTQVPAIPASRVQRQRSLQQLGRGLANAAVSSDGLLDLRAPQRPNPALLDMISVNRQSPAAPPAAPPVALVSQSPPAPPEVPVFAAPDRRESRGYSNGSAYSSTRAQSNGKRAQPSNGNAVSAVHDANVKELEGEAKRRQRAMA